MKRRTFLKAGLFGGSATALLGLSSCTNLPTSKGTRKPSNSGNIRIRREVSDPLAKKDLETYQKGVEIMKSNPRTITTFDGHTVTSGLFFDEQANIHQNFCPHGTWNFFPWHREYLFRYEEIIREVTGDESFALPYWDWSESPRVPEAFLQSGALFMNEKSRGRDLSKDIHQNCSPNRMDSMRKTREFQSFMGSENGSGEPEYGPHNTIHMAVGGTMGTFLSPKDPVFWCHHANVDRLWAEWQEQNDFFQKQAPVRNYDRWLAQKLEGFYDRQGLRFKPRTAKDVVDPKDLGYLYDTSKRQTAAKMDTIVESVPLAEFKRPIIIETEELSVTSTDLNRSQGRFLITLDMNPELLEDILTSFNSYLENPYAFRKFLYNLKIIGVPELPMGTKMTINMRVENQEYLVLNYTPFTDPNSPHAHHGMPKRTLNIDYTKILDEISKREGTFYPKQTQFVVTLKQRDGTPLVLAENPHLNMTYSFSLYGAQQ